MYRAIKKTVPTFFDIYVRMFSPKCIISIFRGPSSLFSSLFGFIFYYIFSLSLLWKGNEGGRSACVVSRIMFIDFVP